MTIAESEFDFGICPQGTKDSHVFWLKSSGDDTLKIINVTPGCGCTKAPLEKGALAVGDSSRLEIIFSTGSYTGRTTKQPRISTNEGPPEKYVRIYTDVTPQGKLDSTYPVVITPPKITITQVAGKERTSTTFSIRNVTDKEVVPTLVAEDNRFVAVKLPKVVKPGMSAEASVELVSRGLEEAFETSVTLAASGGEAPVRLTVPIQRVLRTPGQDITTADQPEGGH